jgi:LmbE family N-acetylglucosaminyl deacetylase
MKKLSLLLFSILTSNLLFAQAEPMKNWHVGEIKNAIKKSQVLGTVLYMAAHPDDENTRFITYAAKGMGLKTGYLSLTRGDGGQNLIGKDVRELLGITRTQELLAARRTDGGQQFFSRANDFGYSKHPDETLTIWDKEQVLSDAVWVIRKFQPDVIVTRFSPDRAGRTHGHHTTSALIAQEAFVAAADPKRFPEQLKQVAVWQVKRLVWNTSSWFFRGKDSKFNPDDYMQLNIGEYNPLLGESYNEIASKSRSMHKSQGFGSSRQRGETIEYFQHLLGDESDNNQLFQNVDLTWKRVKGGDKIGNKLAKIEQNFQLDNPQKSISALASVVKDLRKLSQTNWVKTKTAEIEQIILQCAGVWWEANTDAYYITKGDSLQLDISAINRTEIPMVLKSIQIGNGNKVQLDSTLQNNKLNKTKIAYVIPQTAKISQPYWLEKEGTKGMFAVNDNLQIGKPENDFSLPVMATFQVAGIEIEATTASLYKWTSPVDGEQYRPLVIAPKITANLDQSVLLFANNEAKTVKVLLKSHTNEVSGELSLNLPDGWDSEPESVAFNLEDKGEETVVPFKISPPENQSVGKIGINVKVGKESLSLGLTSLEYAHLPIQTIFPKSEARVVRLEIEKVGKRIGYLQGAGDAIPEALQQIGYQVDILEDTDINSENLKKYDAIIAGVRAYNTNKRMKFHQPILMEYVENGGNYIVQYNTSHRLVTKDLGPYPLKISRDRVTVEEAEITILDSENPVLNTPNKITQADFANWVQERGLYFPNEWDENYSAILSAHDPSEDAKNGGLLVANHGKGSFIYTGYSWFRQLPAGVPGAYRLFVNLISYRNLEGKEK